MKKRFTILYPIDALTIGGAEQQLLELVRMLDKSRFEPIVFTLESGGPLEDEFKAVPGVELLSARRKGKFDFSCLLKIMRILRSRKVDIVQPYLTPANLFGLLAAMVCRTPVKIMTRRPGIEPKEAGMGLRLYYKAEAFLGRFVDWVIPNSQAGKEYMLSKGIREDRIRVIPNGVIMTRLAGDHMTMQEARKKLGLAQDNKVVATIARLVPFKNHALLFQAAVLIIKEIPNAKFIVVGDGPLRQSLEDLVVEMGISSAVVFCGEQRNIGAYLSAMDVAVLPSWEEGFSNFILESMMAAKPVIAIDIAGNRDVVRHNETGFLVPNYNAEVMAEVIIKLLQDEELAHSIGRKAKETVIRDFSLDRMAREYQSLYDESIRSKF